MYKNKTVTNNINNKVNYVNKCGNGPYLSVECALRNADPTPLLPHITQHNATPYALAPVSVLRNISKTP